MTYGTGVPHPTLTPSDIDCLEEQARRIAHVNTTLPLANLEALCETARVLLEDKEALVQERNEAVTRLAAEQRVYTNLNEIHREVVDGVMLAHRALDDAGVSTSPARLVDRVNLLANIKLPAFTLYKQTHERLVAVLATAGIHGGPGIPEIVEGLIKQRDRSREAEAQWKAAAYKRESETTEIGKELDEVKAELARTAEEKSALLQQNASIALELSEMRRRAKNFARALDEFVPDDYDEDDDDDDADNEEW